MDEDLYNKLLASSFRFVSYRPRSVKETKDFLVKKLRRRKNFDPSLIDKVIDRLRELNYLDDRKFVSWWIEQRQTFRPRGVRLIAQELISKGISRETVEELINQKDFKSAEAPTETELARQAVAKKLILWRKLPFLERKKKLYEFLYRRGFDSDTVSSVIDEVGLNGVE